jgi:4-hydroxythreonine-4-phosphate dehydrogenase
MRIGITLGDPRGVGPEVAAAAVGRLRDRRSNARFIFIGPADSPVRHAADEFVVSGGSARHADTAGAGGAAASAIERAVGLARAGDVQAVVTAPIDKSALRAAGRPFPGHTEMLAALSGAGEVVMFMVAEQTALGGALRIALATTHLPLARVPHELTATKLVAQATATARGLAAGWGIEQPRVALCAFNPHASDGGLFGDEEARIYAPAMDTLRRDGMAVTGPVPADTVFVRMLRGEFDAVIAPYHDVGMAAFKTVSFGHGVNVTLGLPFIRTSPDHGTALDIAGRGLADPGSMLAALRLAVRLAGRQASLMTR